MNGTLLSFIFFVFLLFVYIIFILIKEKISNNRLSKIEQTKKFKLTLLNMPEYEIVQYNQVNKYFETIPNIHKDIFYNKELYYIKEKLVLKITLRTNSISYKFKNKYLLK